MIRQGGVEIMNLNFIQKFIRLFIIHLKILKYPVNFCQFCRTHKIGKGVNIFFKLIFIHFINIFSIASKGSLQAAKEVRKRKTSFAQFKESPELIDTTENDEKLGNIEDTENQDIKLIVKYKNES